MTLGRHRRPVTKGVYVTEHSQVRRGELWLAENFDSCNHSESRSSKGTLRCCTRTLPEDRLGAVVKVVNIQYHEAIDRR